MIRRLTPLLQRLPALLLLCSIAQLAAAQVIDLATGKEISEQALSERLRAADIVLLGELHDNRRHHDLRGQLIARFAGKGRTVVAEHLPQGGPVGFESDTRAGLVAAGFDPAGWEWPAHEKLYDQIRASGTPLVGGNLPKEQARQIFMQGVTALPDRMAQTYEAARLDAAAEKALDRDLVDGHCGKLPDRYLLRMRFAQRMTDIALSHALLDHKPAVLVAGNGHVRKDYGVPQVIAAVAPQLRQISVGFLERSIDSPELIQSLAGQYDLVWITERAERKDPCENFSLK
jgi:uncharacterized iron-regulated protein